MTKNGITELIAFLIENYPKNYPKGMPQIRVQGLMKDLQISFKEYADDAVLDQYRKWRESSKWTPYPNEIIEKLGKPKAQHDASLPYKRIVDSDGCVYFYMPDPDKKDGSWTWVCKYKPWWTDDDPRVAEYFKMIEE